MATKSELLASGSLVRLNVPLGRGRRARRELLALPEFIQWLDHTLPGLSCDWHGNTTPPEQVSALFERYVEGLPFRYEADFREVRPLQHGVWELKTFLVRVFGWFLTRDCFVCSAGALADLTKDSSLYVGFVSEAAFRRGRLAIDRPDFVPGVDINAILSNATER